MPNGSNPQDNLQIWLRMLDALEQSAKTNKESTDGATQALTCALEQVKTIGKGNEEFLKLQMQVEALQKQVDSLSEESKASKVGKDDIIWKVLVGFFALVATGLGGSLISLLTK